MVWGAARPRRGAVGVVCSSHTFPAMWIPEPVTKDDINEFAIITAAVAQQRVRRVFSDDLEVDTQLGTRPATIAWHLDNIGAWITVELRYAGLVLVNDVVGRWPEPVRPAAAALWDVIPWSNDDLISDAPVTASRLLEALRMTPDLAQLITPPDKPLMRGSAAWREWGARQEAILLAAQS